jgi:hypothetical protein
MADIDNHFKLEGGIIMLRLMFDLIFLPLKIMVWLVKGVFWGLLILLGLIL